MNLVADVFVCLLIVWAIRGEIRDSKIAKLMMMEIEEGNPRMIGGEK